MRQVGGLVTLQRTGHCWTTVYSYSSKSPFKVVRFIQSFLFPQRTPIKIKPTLLPLPNKNYNFVSLCLSWNSSLSIVKDPALLEWKFPKGWVEIPTVTGGITKLSVSYNYTCLEALLKDLPEPHLQRFSLCSYEGAHYMSQV